MIVCRVTPILSASSCWVISPLSKRSRRIWFVRFSCFLAGILGASMILDQDAHGRQRVDNHEPTEETPVQHAYGHGPVHSIHEGGEKHSDDQGHPKQRVCQNPGSPLDQLIALVRHHLARLLAKEEGPEAEETQEPEAAQPPL